MLAYDLKIEKKDGYRVIAVREILAHPTSLEEFLRKAKKAQEKAGARMSLEEFLQYLKGKKRAQTLSEFEELTRRKGEAGEEAPEMIIVQEPTREGPGIAKAGPGEGFRLANILPILGIGAIAYYLTKRR